MAFTSADIAKIEKAISGGVLTVRYNDRTVTYQSLDHMMRARKIMVDEVSAAADAVAGTKRRRTMRMYQSGTGL